MKNNWFITGTDTEVGKTIFSSILLKIGTKNGYRTVGYKPISSNIIEENNIKKTDIELMKKNSSVYFPNKILNPFNFYEPFPPHFIVQKQNKKINPVILSKNLNILRKYCNWIVIEGAGGWHTPISNDYLYSDWVIKEKIPVILVVGLKIGCINHAILTSNTIIDNNVPFFGWVCNDILSTQNYKKEYLSCLKKHIAAPFLGNIPYVSSKKHFYTNKILQIFDKSIKNFENYH
ncbi:dethiobiotin synthase [Buchnera aphidicola]|nr:dethiobiotin synthase [Buchnera aphidicola]